MELPIALFVTFLGLTVFLTMLGIARRVPALIVGAGIFFFSFVVLTDTIIIASFASEDEETNYMNVLTSSTGITVRQDSSWIRGEFIANSASLLNMKEANCLTAQLSRNGSPDFDTPIVFGVFDSSANTKYEFGRMNVTQTTSDIQIFQKCNMSDRYTMVNGDRIGIKWQDGDSTNNIAVRIHNGDPFDGTNTVATAYSGTWAQTSGSDYSLVIGLDENGSGISRDEFPFDDMAKVIFSLFGAVLMLLGGIISARDY